MNVRIPFLPFFVSIISVLIQVSNAKPQEAEQPSIRFNIKIDDGQTIKGYFVSANAQDVVINNGNSSVTLPRARLDIDEEALFAQAAMSLAQNNKKNASDICRQILIFNPGNAEATQLLTTISASVTANVMSEKDNQPKANAKIASVVYEVGQRPSIKINGPIVRSIKTLRINYEQKFGETVQRGDPTEELVVFNALGRAISFKNSTTTEFYEYDQNGRLVQITRTFRGTKSTYTSRSKKIRIAYDSNGKKIQEDHFEPTGALLERIIFTYDGKGVLTSREVYDSGRNLTKKKIMTYDGSGRLIESYLYSADGKILGGTVSDYTSEGHTTTDYSEAGAIEFVSTYDADDNPVKYERFKDGLPYLRIERQFSGGLVSSGTTIYFSTSGENKGNITSNRPYENKYAFDEYKNWIENERYGIVDRFGKMQKQLLEKSTRIIEWN